MLNGIFLGLKILSSFRLFITLFKMADLSTVSLRSSMPESLKKEPHKLLSAERIYNELKEQAMQEDGQILTKQISQFRQYSQTADLLLQKIRTEKGKTKETISSLEQEVTTLQKNTVDYERGMQEGNKENADQAQMERVKREYMKVCEKRVAEANTITVKHLKHLDMDDRKSLANQPFKWIMMAVYGEAQSKYYWPNFCSEAFKNDKGEDFRERLGKVSAIKAKEEQRIKSENFINNYQKIAQAHELKDCQKEVQTIYKIAKLYLESHQIGKKMVEIEKRISKKKEEMIEKDDEFMRWRARSDALKDRAQLNKQYLKVLEKLQVQLQEKPVKYEQKKKSLEDTTDQLASACKWKPTINMGKEVGSGCNCMF